jgi:hypothetical protein
VKIEDLKQSHLNNSKIKARELEGYDNIKPLSSYFKTNADLKLKTAYIKGSNRISV